jgi:hypothetical protein
MPQTLVQKNGRWQLVGDDHSQDHTPPPPTPDPKPKAPAKKAPKPWWADPVHALSNELRYAGKQALSLQGTQKPGTAQRNPWMAGVGNANPVARLITAAGAVSPVVRQLQAAGVYGAIQTAGEGLIALPQKILAPGKYADPRRSPPGRALNAFTRAGYAALGAKQPEDLTEGQRGVIDNQGRMAGIEIGTLPIGGAVGHGLAAGIKGAGWASRGLRWGTALGVTHGMGALLQDSTQGNMSNMLGALVGIDGVPLAVDPAKDDRVTAAVKSLIPNIVGGELLGLAGSAGARAAGKGFRAVREGLGAPPSRPPSPPAGPSPRPAADDIAYQDWLRENTPASVSPTIRTTGPDQPVRQRATGEDVVYQDWLQRNTPKPDFAPKGYSGSTVRSSGADGPWSQRWEPKVYSGATVRGSGEGFQNIRRYQRAAGANTAHVTAGERLQARGLVEDIEGQQRFTQQALEKPAPVQIPQTPDQARDAVLARWGRGAQQPADQVPGATEMVATPKAATADGFTPEERARTERNMASAAAPVAPDAAPVTTPVEPPAPTPAVAEQSSAAPAATVEEVAPLDPSSYDPALPEVADAQKLVSQLDPAELQAVAAVGADGGPVLQHIEEVIASRPAPQPRPEISEAWAGVPTNSLSEIYLNGIGELQPWAQLLDKINPTTLKELSHPEASPRLSQLISDATGKAWEAFDREDMINGIKALSADGTTILPNRLSGDVRLMRVEDLAAAPQEFQYKEGTDAKGVQIASHLRDVKKWDPNAEGVLEVFPDPRDGITKVVEGHGRRALAMRLGVPTVPVKEVNATNVPGARSAGAISNISQGNGTPFDAAKFIKGTGMTDQAQLQAAGIALDRGFGRQGLALSKLPPEIFQDAVNSEHKLGRYVALGESGLDEPGMRGAYQVLKQRPKMTEDTFREVLDQAKQQGNVVASSAQGGLFGDEVLNPMLQRAELAADVRAALAKDRRLFGIMTRNADTLSEAGNTTIDTAAAGQRVADAQQALGLFDTLKNQAGPVGELLSKGAERIAQGENASIVARQISKEIGNSIERELTSSGMKATPQELAPPPPAPPPIPEPDRATLEAHAIQRAIANGEVRPTEMQPLDLPPAPSADIRAVQRELAAMDPTLPLEDQLPNMPATRQAAADELRLAAEYARQDAEIAWAAEKAAREAEGYDLLSLQEKKAQGLGAEWVEPVTPEVMDTTVMPREEPRKVSEVFRDLMRKMAESDARMFRELGEFTGEMRQQINDLADLDAPATGKAAKKPKRLPSRPAQIAAEVSGAPEFTLPPELAKASPRYGRNALQFESDLDRAAYVLANDRTKGESKSAAKFRDALAAAGLDPDKVAAHGKTVKAAVKAVTRDTSGETVVVPVQDFAAGRPRLPLPEQQRQIEGTKAQIDDLQQKLNEGGCGT